jgi:hypothetical protein
MEKVKTMSNEKEITFLLNQQKLIQNRLADLGYDAEKASQEKKEAKEKLIAEIEEQENYYEDHKIFIDEIRSRLAKQEDAMTNLAVTINIPTTFFFTANHYIMDSDINDWDLQCDEWDSDAYLLMDELSVQRYEIESDLENKVNEIMKPIKENQNQIRLDIENYIKNNNLNWQAFTELLFDESG